jgi:hypothetical protein
MVLAAQRMALLCDTYVCVVASTREATPLGSEQNNPISPEAACEYHRIFGRCRLTTVLVAQHRKGFVAGIPTVTLLASARFPFLIPSGEDNAKAK